MEDSKEVRKEEFLRDHPSFGEKKRRRRSLNPPHDYTTEEIVKIAKEYTQKGAFLLSQEMGLMPAQVNAAVARLRREGVVINHRSKGSTQNRAVWKAALEQLKTPEI